MKSDVMKGLIMDFVIYAISSSYMVGYAIHVILTRYSNISCDDIFTLIFNVMFGIWMFCLCVLTGKDLANEMRKRRNKDE